MLQKSSGIVLSRNVELEEQSIDDYENSYFLSDPSKNQVQLNLASKGQNILRISVSKRAMILVLIVLMIIIITQIGYSFLSTPSQNNIKQQQNTKKQIGDTSIPIVNTTQKSSENNEYYKNIPKANIQQIMDDNTQEDIENKSKSTKETSSNDEIKQGIHNSKDDQSEQDMKFLKEGIVDSDSLLWGHYKPHLLYSISQRKSNPISMSMSYLPMLHFYDVMTNFKSNEQSSNVFYDFKYNDGVRFSEFLIKDNRYYFQMQSSFIKRLASKVTNVESVEEGQDWINVHKVFKSPHPTSNLRGEKSVRSLIFSLAKEVYEKEIQPKYYHFNLQILNESIHVDVYVVSTPKINLKDESLLQFEGSFVFFVKKDGQKLQGNLLNDIIRFAESNSLAYEKNWQVKDKIESSFQKGNEEYLLNSQSAQAGTPIGFVLLQFLFEATSEYSVHISYSSSKKGAQQQDPTLFPLEQSMLRLINQFETRLSKSLQINNKNEVNNRNCTLAAISNLFGGTTYKYGLLQYTQKEEERRSQPQEIFSFTPSRSRFGWSFLWDDGFHNAVASKFQPKLSAIIIKSWLDSMNSDGWICREQSRGQEAFGLCSCPKFIKKDNRDGNPPSLILAIEYFLRDQTDVITNFIEEGYLEKIDKWYHWYLKSQMIRDEIFIGNLQNFTDTANNSFVFRFWDNEGSRKSLNSGMDDYPRNDQSQFYTAPIGHIDAQSWMYHFTHVMEQLFEFSQNKIKQQYFSLLKETILERTRKYFLDKNDSIFKDIISKNASLSNAQYTPHIGYPNLLPLAFGIVRNETAELGNLIKIIMNKEILWTDYGLRSISKQSPYWRSGNIQFD